jgi:hypothetical protein
MAQARLLRCIFGNPFTSPTIEPSWRSWQGGTVVELARRADEERCFDLMPKLGDALEESGCRSEAIIKHCRLDEEHAAGCWVIELLLRKK